MKVRRPLPPALIGQVEEVGVEISLGNYYDFLLRPSTKDIGIVNIESRTFLYVLIDGILISFGFVSANKKRKEKITQKKDYLLCYHNQNYRKY